MWRWLRRPRRIRKPWWQPLEEPIEVAVQSPEVARQARPIEAAPQAAGNTGEGTRYGTRPKRTGRKHARPAAKAEQ